MMEFGACILLNLIMTKYETFLVLKHFFAKSITSAHFCDPPTAACGELKRRCISHVSPQHDSDTIIHGLFRTLGTQWAQSIAFNYLNYCKLKVFDLGGFIDELSQTIKAIPALRHRSRQRQTLDMPYPSQASLFCFFDLEMVSIR